MRKFFTFASLVALMLSACSKEAAQSEQAGKGQVTINCNVETVVDTRANISCTTPKAEDFALTIEGVGHTYIAEYDAIPMFNDGDNYLRLGSYVANIVAGDVKDEGYDKVAFVGSSEFSVSARKQTDVAIVATIANAIVKVEVTDAFKGYFTDYKLTLKTALGNEFDVTKQQEPIFVAPTSFTISGFATKQPNQSGVEGVVVTLPEYKKVDAAARTFYTVKFDVEQAGSASLTITLNDTLVETYTIETELNDNAK
ncbi:MAG: DUF4493 domain-containing protein [Alistipes sp.]|nr:DUF4493 domain-containing protein [Alistipes sp.]